MTHYTIRNDHRVPVVRKSADSVWPLKRTDGLTWAEAKALKEKAA